MYNPGVATPNSWPKRLILLLSISLIIFNLVRIIRVPVTFDEAWTYVNHASATYRNILICNPLTANNHILNSLLTKFFIKLFNSNSLFVLRFPNLIAQVGYLWFGYLLLRRLLDNDWWVLLGFILLNFNPFLFDFWGLCRGYGIAISLMTAATCFFLKYVDTDKPAALFLSLLLMALSTFTVFSMLNVYVSLVGIILTRSILFRTAPKKKYILTELAAIIFCSLLLYILIVQPIIELKQAGEFYYGLNNGFVIDTIGTLVKESIFSPRLDWRVKSIVYASVTITILAGIYWLIHIKQISSDKVFTKGTGLWLLLIIPAASTIIQHKLFGTLFLIERTALFFYPLFIIQLLAFLSALKSNSKVPFIFITICGLFTLFNFALNMNTSFTRTWYHDRYDELVVKRITKAHQQPVKVKVYWMVMPSFKYYSLTSQKTFINGGNVGDVVAKEFGLDKYADTAYDYYYIHRDDIGTVPGIYLRDTSFFDGKYILFKKR